MESGEHAWQRLVLFDIDNTLTSINAGNLPQRRGMNRSLERVHEAPDAFEDIAFTGDMDLPLMIEVCRKLGFMSGGGGSETLPDISAFRAAYLDYRAGALADWAEGWFARGSSTCSKLCPLTEGCNWDWKPATSGTLPGSLRIGLWAGRGVPSRRYSLRH